jgi:hypothetical protein
VIAPQIRGCGIVEFDGGYFMKTGTTLVTTLFTFASFPLLAQQPPPTSQPNRPATQQSPQAAEPQNPAATQEAPVIEMSPVNGELVSKLDSKTAKTGDSVVVQTKASAKTADGTEIPKGSKLVGHVLAAKPSGAGENSQVALQFDHIELKGGQNLPIHSQIQSIASAGDAASTAASSGPPASGSANPSASAANGGSSASGAPQTAGGNPGTSPAANGAPPAGTVVARTGNIAIATTSVPGVLLANNAPGQQDPRMAQASSILLGAKQDIQLDGGTQMVVGVSAAGGRTQ